MKSFFINSIADMESLGTSLSGFVEGGEVIYLSGELGAGKTTLVRGFLVGLGHQGHVKSPTYTLVETYSLLRLDVYHFDLYRINNSEELEAMGVRDYFENNSVCLFEWPEQGGRVLPAADIIFKIAYTSQGRQITVESASEKGTAILNQL